MNDQTELKQATIEAERALLGCLLLGHDTSQVQRCALIVNTNDFAGYFKDYKENRHARIFKAINDVAQPDMIGTAHRLSQLDCLQASDISYMFGLVADCPTSLDAEYYAGLVRDYSVKRQIDYYTRKGDFHKIQTITNRTGKIKFTGAVTL